MTYSESGNRLAFAVRAGRADSALNARAARFGTVSGLALLACTACSLYDSSLLDGGGAHSGNAGQTNQSGSGGISGDESGGLGSDAAGAGAIDDGGSTAGGGVPGASGGGTAGVVSMGGMGGTAGMGGSAGRGGSQSMGGTAGMMAGTAGMAGIAGNGGTAGKGGNAGSPGGGSGGSGGMSGSATGCARLSVPLDATTDKAHFVISMTTPVDLSHATISTRLYVQAGAGGSIFNYVQDSGTFHFLGVPSAQRHELSSFSGWYTLTWDVGAEPDAGTGIVKTNIKNIGLEISAQPSSFWSDPTIIFIDSLTITTPALSFPFDASASVYPTATTGADGQALWLNSNTLDTTASGVTLRWQATCP